MHETAVVAGLMDILLRRAGEHGIGRVSVVRLEIGRLHGLDLRQIRGVFELLAEGTIAEGTQLEIEDVAVKARCRNCATEWQVAGYRFECPGCHSTDADVIRGRELHIVSFDGQPYALNTRRNYGASNHT